MEVKDYLETLGIIYKEHTHPAVYNCEQADRVIENQNWFHVKNLFLKNRKSKKFYLAVLPAEKKLDLEKIEEITKEKLKFANETDLKDLLDLEPGAVSVFGLINDSDKIVSVLMDKEVYESETVGFHPNINTKTLELTKENFHKFLNSLSNEISIM